MKRASDISPFHLVPRGPLGPLVFPSCYVTSTSQHQIFDEKFDQKPESVRIKMADLAGR